MTTSPQFDFTCMNPLLSPYTPLNGHMIKGYAIFLKPIFFWDTLYLFNKIIQQIECEPQILSTGEKKLVPK